MIRKGEESSFVELCLFLPNHQESMDGNIIVSREVWENGRNMCKINGRMVTVSELKGFMQNIIDIHGQHENQTLMDTAIHISLLDAFSGNELEKNQKEYKEYYEKYIEINAKLKENYGDDKEKQRKLDLLKYQAKEIETAKLSIGEDKDLEAQKEKINNTQKIAENLQVANNQIDEVAIDAISSAIRSMEKIACFDENYSKSLSELKSIYYELQETGRTIGDFSTDISFDEEQIKQTEERLDLIYSLKRKYGNSIEEILDYEIDIKAEIEKIENLEEYILSLKKEKEEIENSMQELSIKMHDIRLKRAKILEAKVNQELVDLEMKNASFKVQINWEEEKFSKNGKDNIEFLICTNIGEEAKPLTKIASGGEMSRIMLAIKTVLADVDNVPVLVFDEIDTGISGKAANAVAEKLEKIAKKHQVICVTHLASIAARGDYNYFIGKEIENNKTTTQVRMLNEEETIYEIARIASGAITEVTLNHARELRRK